MTALVTITKANTFFDFRTLTNSLAVLLNNLTETGNTFRANGSLLLSGSGTALTVNNAATFGTVNTTTAQANTVISTFITANGISVLNHANNAYNQGNTANTIAVQSGTVGNSAFTVANTANTIAVQSGTVGNSAFTAANTANTRAMLKPMLHGQQRTQLIP
jgi:hypothetical protein